MSNAGKQHQPSAMGIQERQKLAWGRSLEEGTLEWGSEKQYEQSIISGELLQKPLHTLSPSELTAALWGKDHSCQVSQKKILRPRDVK